MTTPSDFDLAVEFVLEREGGYVNDKDDPGGETNMGISKRKYPTENIKSLTRERAKSFYKRDYWFAFGCDKMTWPTSLIVFDTAANMHPSVVAKLQKESTDWFDFMFRRLYQYAVIATKPRMIRFLPGWVIRIYYLYRFMRKTTEARVQEKQ